MSELVGYPSYDDDEDMAEEENMDLDDSLSALERLNKYKDSHLLLQRLRLVKELSDIATQIGYQQTKDNLLEALNGFSRDREGTILQALAEQIPFFCQFLIENGGEEGLQIVLTTLISIVNGLIVDEHHQVRSATSDSFVKLAQYLSKSQQLEYVIPVINKLATNTIEEDHRIEAAEILNKMAEAKVFKEDLLVSYAIDRICTLAKDPMFRVRKAIATTIGVVSALVPEDIVTAQLLPTFLQLTKDEIWGVKKACAEAIVSISKSVSKVARVNELSPVYESLIQDSSRWVRNSTFQYLGAFIATLDADSVSSQLLDHYLSMVEGTKNQYGDSDTVRYCAFSFPGVLLTLGKEKWNVLKDVYSTLSQDLQWKVRRTLSHSLHEVANILGTELTEQYLLPTFELFLKDLDQVKVGVIRHLAKFLKVLSPKVRAEYVETMKEIQTLGANWRFRKLLAKQIGSISQLYTTDTVKSSIIPIAIQLCEDQVTTVRYAVTKELGVFVNHLLELNQSLGEEFIEQILPFATKASCYERQTFCMICENLVQNVSAEIFLQKFYPHLVRLSSDKVPNIRFIVARIFVQQLSNNDSFTGVRDELNQNIERLKNDKDREVRFFSVSPPKL